MKTPPAVKYLSLALILAAGSSAAVAQAPAAKPAAAPPPTALSAAGAVASGQAVGTFTAHGKTYKLAYAAAFVDQEDKAKPVFLLLTEQAVPAADWKSRADLSAYRRNKNPLIGVVFRLDGKREVIGADYYDGDFPTNTSGMFDLNLTSPAGKVFAGSAKATASAGKMTEPIGLSVNFNAALK